MNDIKKACDVVNRQYQLRRDIINRCTMESVWSFGLTPRQVRDCVADILDELDEELDNDKGRATK